MHDASGAVLKENVAKVAPLVESVVSKLDQHITISKDYDAAQEVSARKLNEHTAQTEKWTEMLTDMHGAWSKNQRLPPDETHIELPPKHLSPRPTWSGLFLCPKEGNSMADLDPQEAIELEKYEDPNPMPITDPQHLDYNARQRATSC